MPELRISYGDARTMTLDEISVGLVQAAECIRARPKPPPRGRTHG
jgi:hypothetical protein